MSDLFLETSKENLELFGMWKEEYKSTVMKAIESVYKKQITDKWAVTDIVMNGDNVLVKWSKRFIQP